MNSPRARIAALVWVATLFVFGLAGPPLRAATTILTSEGATNALGQPVMASVQYTVQPNSIIVRLTNLTPHLRSSEQVLRGVSFRINGNRSVQAAIGMSEGTTRVISAEGVKDGDSPIEVPWTIHVEGNQVSLAAPGERYGIISEPKEGRYEWAEKGLRAAGSNPYLGRTVIIEVQIPGTPLTENLIDVSFMWERTVGAGLLDRALTAPTVDAPLPPQMPPDMPPPEPPGGGIIPSGPPPEVPPPVVPPLPSIPPGEQGNPEPPPRSPEPPSPEPPQSPPPVDSVPEPGTLGLFVVGVGMLLRRVVAA